MRAAILWSISGALLATVGCGSASIPVGTFRGERRLEVRPGTDPVVAAQMRRVVLQIEASGRASLADGGFPSNGEVFRDGDRLRFEVHDIAGVDIGKQPPDVPRTITFGVHPDGSLTYGSIRLVL